MVMVWFRVRLVTDLHITQVVIYRTLLHITSAFKNYLLSSFSKQRQ